MRNWKAVVITLLCVVGLATLDASAAERPYTGDSIWTVTLVKVKPGMDGVYLRDLASTWRAVMDEAKKQDLILSYKILNGNGANRDDWTMMLLVEQKNWAAFDGADGKFDAIVEKLVGPETKQLETMVKRGDVREIVGVRNFQEVTFK